MPLDAKRVAGQGNPLAISTVLAKPAEIATPIQDIQAAVMPKPCEPFDYGEVAPDIATALRAQASRIRDMITVTTSAVIQIGNDLIAVKQVLERGTFRSWIESECGFSARTAENYMGAARLAEGRNATVAFLQPATVYRLAAKSAPAEVVNAVLQRAEQGEAVSDRDVVAAIDEVRFRQREAERASKRKPLTKRQLALRENDRRATEEYDTRRTVAAYDAAASLVAELGREKTLLVYGLLMSNEFYFGDLLIELKKQISAGASE